MKKPKKPENEPERLKELENYQLIGLIENEDYDFITSMAAQLCGTKVSLISLITQDEQWFLSHHGLETRSTPRDYAFCAHAINDPNEPFIVENATTDERFNDNPLTTDEPHVVFYAGIPLVTSNGYCLGTLCTIDNNPHKLSEYQIESLKKLAKQTIKLFELRKKTIDLDMLNIQLKEKNELLLQNQKVNQLGNWELDIQTNITSWDESIYQIHDVTTSFNTKKAVGLYHPRCQQKIKNAISNCLSKDESFNLVCRMLTPKDNLKWVRTTGHKVGDKIIGSIQDVTSLKQSQMRFKSILEGTHAGTWEWNIQTGETVFNERWAEIVGYTLEELTPISIDTWVKLAHPDDFEQAHKKLQDCFDQKEAYYEFEIRMKHKNGHWIWVHDRGKVFEWTQDGEPLMMYGTHQDITERKQSERVLQETLSKFQAIVDASVHHMIIAADKKGTITLFNSGAELRLGYKAEEVIGKHNPGIFRVPKELELESRRLSDKYQQEIKGFDVFVYEAKIGKPCTKEWTLVSKAGEGFPVLLSINAIRVENEIVGYLGVVSDISELKQREKEIRSLLDVTNDQNDRLRNFTQIVSHNLRSHSVGISQLLALINMEFPDIKEHELIQYLEKGVDNLNQTVNDLTEIVKINFSENEISEVIVNDILQKNIESLRLQLKEANLEIINNIDEDFSINAIPAYIDSIILNMITNAIKYRSKERKSYLKINTSVEKDKIVLSFKDNGQGIDLERHRDQIFEMYKTFHDHEEARGVGLFITKNQVNSMRGNITVVSEVNVGTTFKIKLPI